MTDKPDPSPAMALSVTWDPEEMRWTAKADALGVHGVGVSPGAAVDDLWFAIPDLIAIIDAMGDGLTRTWTDRRAALIEAAERGGLPWRG